MTMTAESVAAASAAWVWVPDNATFVETDEYTILRMPDYFEFQLSVSVFKPTGPLSRRRGREGEPRPHPPATTDRATAGRR